MPLPFAPKPDSSRVYDSLKDKLLTDITAANFDSLKGSVYAQGVDGAEDEYRRLLLLGLAADQVSVAGPLAGTATIQFVETDTGSGSETVKVFRPQPGEVHQFMGAVMNTFNGSYAELELYDGVNYCELGQESSAGTPWSPPTFGPIYVSYDVWMTVKWAVMSGDCDLAAAFIRVR